MGFARLLMYAARAVATPLCLVKKRRGCVNTSAVVVSQGDAWRLSSLLAKTLVLMYILVGRERPGAVHSRFVSEHDIRVQNTEKSATNVV